MCQSTDASPQMVADADTMKETRDANPLETASFFSKLLFTWPFPLLKLGMQRPLADADLAHVAHIDSSEYNLEYLTRIWQAEQRRNPSNPSLHRALVRDFFWSRWYVQPMMMIGGTARVAQAIVLGYLIESFEGANDQGYLWASMVVLCGLVIFLEHHHVFFNTWRKGMQFRVACVAAIHDKSLRLSSTHQETSASYGRIMNLASNDVERFLLATLFISHLFWAPVQSIAILAVGVYLMGWAFAAGFLLLVLVLVPLQFYLSGKFAYYRSKIAAITDKRVTFVSQAVRGARVMKMSGYEWRFLERIQAFRREEVEQIAKANNLKAWNEALFFCTNVVISAVIFYVHVFIGGTLQPGDVFTVFTLINILQLEMTKHVSLGVMGTSEAYVSVTRIQKFLDFPEQPTQPVLREQATSDDNDHVVIALSKVKSYWNRVKSARAEETVYLSDDAMKVEDEDDKDGASTDGESTDSVYLALDKVSVYFLRGEITAVIGSVGAGKSALLQAIVQELPIAAGSVTRRYQTLAYASQDAWVMDGTVKENILTGLVMDDSWYRQVVEACGLAIDFAQLRDGDQTVVGDRGVQLSGGQRARIGLARALYKDADVLVVDDPLSAVDSRVGRQIFHQALEGLAVARGKCVILATHQHQYVSDCKCVLVANGMIACIGSYQDCVKASNGKLTAHAADDAVDNLGDDSGRAGTGSEKQNEKTEVVVKESTEDDDERDVNDDDDNKEMNRNGFVELSTYVAYVQAMGGWWVGLGLFLTFCITQASVLLSVGYIGKWAELPKTNQSDWDILTLVGGLCIAVIIFSLFRAFVSFQVTIRASQRLHDAMAKAILRAKIEFYDTNPLGRIMNRFSADVGSNDDLLPPTLFDFLMVAFMVIGAIVTTVVTLPFTLIAVPPLMWYFIRVRHIFVTSTRELKRLEGLARSPIFAVMSESLGGIATIRANDAVPYFKEKFRNAHDAHTRAFFSFVAASRWVGMRMDSIVFMFLAVVCYLSVLFQSQAWYKADPAILGLAISMLLQLAGLFQWCIRQSAEVVNQFVSVERVLQFGQVESEAELEENGDSALLSSGWPSQGAIDFKEVSIRYRASLPLALDKVNFCIPPNSRVGVVGRTGSGKSTVVQTLFRLLEAEHGRIMIDDVNVAQLGLHALRTKISVIPQVPTLFSGCSVRENLDLFGLHTDESLLRVLRACHLEEVINALPHKLDSVVAENGSNFSVGQRQLLCLARAILNENKILVLDEATASVDRRTDQLLQETLQHEFYDGTILAVAHRLDTIIENDLVLVLGHGHVLEFGSPAELIQAGGSFASMVADTGDAMAADLRQRAFQKEAKGSLWTEGGAAAEESSSNDDQLAFGNDLQKVAPSGTPHQQEESSPLAISKCAGDDQLRRGSGEGHVAHRPSIGDGQDLVEIIEVDC